MGVGIWSMHFTGMLAFRMGMPVTYDVPITPLSVVVAVAASALAPVVVARGLSGRLPLLVAGPIMGIGIAGMHYTGMAGMRMAAAVRYDSSIVVRRAGISVYLTKPFRQSELRDAIVPALDRVPGEADGDADRPLVTCHTLQEIAAVSCARALHTEDNAINQKVAGRMLENIGHRADILSDGCQAVEAVSKGD
jgi:CheY-like chemotaxis protein